MAAFVIDTNVAVSANGRNHADSSCVIACVDALAEVQAGGIVVLDDGMLILQEYMNNLSMSGEPGAGDAFMKWVWNVQGDERVCERVSLGLRDVNGQQDFLQFPDDPELAHFDPADRKFAAVGLASVNAPTVLNAVDSDWAETYAAFVRHGLRICFLCPQHVSQP